MDNEEAVSWTEFNISNQICVQGTSMPISAEKRAESLRPGHCLVVVRYTAEGYARTDVYYANGRRG